MRATTFTYTIGVSVEISGNELLALCEASRRHYDGRCRSASALGGFLYGMVNHWLLFSPDIRMALTIGVEDLGKLTPVMLERTQEINMSGDQLDTLAKIVEHADPSMSFTLVQMLRRCSEERERATSIAPPV